MREGEEKNGPVKTTETEPSVTYGHVHRKAEPIQNTHNISKMSAFTFEMPEIKKSINIPKTEISTAENFPSASRNESNKIPITQFVKELRKDNPLVKAKIPSSYQPVQMVKQLSEAGKAALEVQESPL